MALTVKVRNLDPANLTNFTAVKNEIAVTV